VLQPVEFDQRTNHSKPFTELSLYHQSVVLSSIQTASERIHSDYVPLLRVTGTQQAYVNAVHCNAVLATRVRTDFEQKK
jgi:hypothetical protein